MSEEFEGMEMPDMSGIEYEIACESIAKMFRALVAAGLRTDEAAEIMAAVMSRRP